VVIKFGGSSGGVKRGEAKTCVRVQGKKQERRGGIEKVLKHRRRHQRGLRFGENGVGG